MQNKNKDRRFKHGHASRIRGMTKTYKAWCSMRLRCNNKNDPAYTNYGGRGIVICKRWALYKNFLEDMGKRPTNKSLDRINNNGGYAPSNCRWATRFEQQANRRGNIMVNFKGKLVTLHFVAIALGLPYPSLHKRIKKENYCLDDAIKITIAKRRKFYRRK